MPSTAMCVNGRTSFSLRCAAATSGPRLPSSSTTRELVVATDDPSPLSVVLAAPEPELESAAPTLPGSTGPPASAALRASQRSTATARLAAKLGQPTPLARASQRAFPELDGRQVPARHRAVHGPLKPRGRQPLLPSVLPPGLADGLA